MTENTREDENRQEEMRCVYMGPPMKETLREKLRARLAERRVKKEPYPRSFADEEDRVPDESVIAGVYAGPVPADDSIRPVAEAVYAAPRRPDSPMMLVYAGPGYFNKINQEKAEASGIVPCQPRNTENDGKPTVCPSCGADIPHGEFCPECGKMLPWDLLTRCPGCGKIVRRAKFCAECGMCLFPDEESRPSE